MVPKKDKKPKKSTWKFSLDLTHPGEDGVFDSGNSEQFLHEKVKVFPGKTGNLGNVVHIKAFKNKIMVVSEEQFSKSINAGKKRNKEGAFGSHLGKLLDDNTLRQDPCWEDHDRVTVEADLLMSGEVEEAAASSVSLCLPQLLRLSPPLPQRPVSGGLDKQVH
eukprot:bmy_01802T0